MAFQEKSDMAEINRPPVNLGPCPCGRGDINLSGTCDDCLAENAAAFWMFIDGTITEAGYMRRLRKTGRKT